MEKHRYPLCRRLNKLREQLSEAQYLAPRSPATYELFLPLVSQQRRVENRLEVGVASCLQSQLNRLPRLPSLPALSADALTRTDDGLANLVSPLDRDLHSAVTRQPHHPIPRDPAFWQLDSAITRETMRRINANRDPTHTEENERG